MVQQFLDRHIRGHVVEALADTRVVVLLGARQVGKSTLAQEIAAHEHPAEVVTLDDLATRVAAERDPTGFIADLATPIVIDEVQRVPEVLLAIKQRVDSDRRPGQFMRSSNATTAPRSASRQRRPPPSAPRTFADSHVSATPSASASRQASSYTPARTQ